MKSSTKVVIFICFLVAVGVGVAFWTQRPAKLAEAFREVTSDKGEAVFRPKSVRREVTVLVQGLEEEPLSGVVVRMRTSSEHLIVHACDPQGNYFPVIWVLEAAQLRAESPLELMRPAYAAVPLAIPVVIVGGTIVIQLAPVAAEAASGFAAWTAGQVQTLTQALISVPSTPVPLTGPGAEVHRAIKQGMENPYLVVVNQETARIETVHDQVIDKAIEEWQKEGDLQQVDVFPEFPGVVVLRSGETEQGTNLKDKERATRTQVFKVSRHLSFPRSGGLFEMTWHPQGAELYVYDHLENMRARIIGVPDGGVQECSERPWWSSDGAAIARLDRGVLKVASAQSARTLSFDGAVKGPILWSPDSHWLVFSRRAGLTLADLQTGTAMTLESESQMERPRIKWPSFSPDSRTLCYLVQWPETYQLSPAMKNALVLFDLESERTRVLYSANEVLWAPHWSPNGGKIVLCVGEATLVIDVQSGSVINTLPGAANIEGYRWDKRRVFRWIDDHVLVYAISLEKSARLGVISADVRTGDVLQVAKGVAVWDACSHCGTIFFSQSFLQGFAVRPGCGALAFTGSPNRYLRLQGEVRALDPFDPHVYARASNGSHKTKLTASIIKDRPSLDEMDEGEGLERGWDHAVHVLLLETR